jgi:integrase
MVHVRDSKNGSARDVPVDLPPEILDGLETIPTPSRPVFGFTQSQFNHAWTAAVELAGFANTGLVPHALRHTRATRLVAAGVPLPIVAKLLGHKSIRTTMRYTHVNVDDCRQALARAGL